MRRLKAGRRGGTEGWLDGQGLPPIVSMSGEEEKKEEEFEFESKQYSFTLMINERRLALRSKYTEDRTT